MASLSEQIEQCDNFFLARASFGIQIEEGAEALQLVDWDNPCDLLYPGHFRALSLHSSDLCPSEVIHCDWRAVLREQRFAYPSSDCQMCGETFGWVLNKRYHCRGCGRTLCYNCAADFVWVPTLYTHLRRYKDYVVGARMCYACVTSVKRVINTQKLYDQLRQEAPRIPTLCRLAMLNVDWRDAVAFYLSEMRLLQHRLPNIALLDHETNFLENNKLLLRAHTSWLPALSTIDSYLGQLPIGSSVAPVQAATDEMSGSYSESIIQERYPEDNLRAPTLDCDGALCVAQSQHDDVLANSIAYIDRSESTEPDNTSFKEESRGGDREGGREGGREESITKEESRSESSRNFSDHKKALAAHTSSCCMSTASNVVRLMAAGANKRCITELLQHISPYSAVCEAIAIVMLCGYSGDFTKALLRLSAKNTETRHAIYWYCAARPQDLQLLQLKNKLLTTWAPRVNGILASLDILESECATIKSDAGRVTPSDLWRVEGASLPLEVCPLRPSLPVSHANIASDCAALVRYTTSDGVTHYMEFVHIDLEEHQRTAALLTLLYNTVGPKNTPFRLLQVRPCMEGCGFVERPVVSERTNDILEMTSLEQYISSNNMNTPFTSLIKNYLDSLAFCVVIGLLCGRDCTKDTIVIYEKRIAIFDAPPLLSLASRRRVCVQSALLEFSHPLTDTTTGTYFVSLCCDLLLRVRREYVLLHSLIYALDFGYDSRDLASRLASLLYLGENESSVAASFSRLVTII